MCTKTLYIKIITTKKSWVSVTVWLRLSYIFFIKLYFTYFNLLFLVQYVNKKWILCFRNCAGKKTKRLEASLTMSRAQRSVLRITVSMIQVSWYFSQHFDVCKEDTISGDILMNSHNKCSIFFVRSDFFIALRRLPRVKCLIINS